MNIPVTGAGELQAQSASSTENPMPNHPSKTIHFPMVARRDPSGIGGALVECRVPGR